MAEINSFDAAMQGALASTQDAPVSEPTSPEPTPTPTTPSTGTAPAPQSFEFLDGNTPVKATADEVREWRKGNLRLQDYTRKTQEIAAARQELEQALPQIQQLYTEHQQLQQFIRDRDQVLRYAEYLRSLEAGQQPAQPEAPPDLTQLRATLQQQVQQQVAGMRQSLQQEMAAERAKAQYDREVDGYKSEFDGYVKGLLDQHPVLRDIDGIEALIRTDAAALARASGNFGVEDAKRFLLEAAQSRASHITTAWENRLKERQAKKQAALRGIQPPGGGVAQTKPWKGKDLGSQDHLNAIAAAIAAGEV